MGKTPALTCCGLVCIFDIVAVIFACMILIQTSGQVEKASFDLSIIDELQQDWTNIPYASFTARTDESCQPGEDPITWTYKGTQRGCIVNGNLETYSKYLTRSDKRRPACEGNAPAIEPRSIETINGTALCGRRAGYGFAKAPRPDPTTKKCPAGTLPCSNTTSVDNTICFSADKQSRYCPITSVNIFEIGSSDETNFKYYNSSKGVWTVAPAWNGYNIYTTKTEVDALPVSNFKYTEKPCMHPKDIQTPVGAIFYLLERQQVQTCSIEPNTGLVNDPRYLWTGFQNNHLSFMTEDPIPTLMSQLVPLPEFNSRVPNARGKYQTTMHNLWYRNTLPWSLDCEKQGNSRDQFYAILSNSAPIDAGVIGMINAFTIIAIIFTGFCGCIGCAGFCIQFQTAVWISFVITIAKAGCTIGWALGAAANVAKIGAFLLNSRATVNVMSKANGCSDAFVQINQTFYLEELDNVEATMGPVNTMAILMVVFFSLSAIAMVIANILKMQRS